MIELKPTDLEVSGNGHHAGGELFAEVAAPHRRRGILATILDYGVLRTAPYGVLPIALFAGITFFLSVQTQTLSFAGPNIAQDLRLNLAQVIGISVLVNFMLIFAGVGFAWLLDRRRRAPWFGIGSAVNAIGLMLQSRSTNQSNYVTPSVFSAVGGTAADTPSLSLIADYYPVSMRGRVFALTQTLRRVAVLLATVVGGLAVGAWGWRSLNFILALPVLVLGVVAMIVLREPIRGYLDRRHAGMDEQAARIEEAPLSFGESARRIWSVRTVRRLIYADAIDYVGSAPFALFSSFMLADYYGLNIVQRAWIAVPSVVLALIGGALGGGAIDALTARAPSTVLRVAGAVSIVGAVGAALVAAAPPLAVLIAFNAVLGFAIAFVSPATTSLTTQVIPSATRTLGLSLTNLAQVPGLILFSVFGVIQHTYGYSASLMACVPFLVLGAIVRFTAADFFESDRRNQMVQMRATAEWQREHSAEEKGSEGSSLLLCRSVDVGYDDVQVLFGADFEVRNGEIVALLGTNGAGKSTLLRAISGIQEASGGAIIFDGRDITHMPAHEIAKLGVVHMPGGRGVFPGMSVRDNLELGTWLVDDPEAARQRLAEVYEIFPVLRERGAEPAGALSGGEQQMLSLSQAFMARPRLLLIDELSLGLSPAVVGQLLEIVKRMRDQGTAVVVVEQSINVALTTAERAVFMEKGEVRFSGPTKDLLRRPDILRAVYVRGSATVGGARGDEEARRRHLAAVATAPVVLKVEGVAKRFGGVVALDGVSLSLRKGEVLGLIGPNGSGKTTLFDIISGEQAPDAGTIVYDGQDVTSLAAELRARRGLVRRFQDARLFPSLTVFESLLVALDQQVEVRNPLLAAAGLGPARNAERRLRVKADRLIELLALEAYRDKFVSELSTGVRRLTDMAYALAAEAKVLLLDEPSSGIAQAEAENLGPLIRRIRHQADCSILIIEHDIPLITAVSDEMIAMERGHVLTRGTPEAVLADDRVAEAFLGTSEAAIRRSGALA